MPTFDTPEPIHTVLDLVFGQARIVASDRTDTTVDVRPRDRTDPADVTTAERTRVDYADGRLQVTVPKPRGSSSTDGAVIVVIELPTGSSVHGSAAATDFRCEGVVGECRLTTGFGHIELDRTGTVHLTASLGDITVERATGGVEVTAGRGNVRIGEIDGTAPAAQAADGRATAGEATGVVRVHADNGDIHIGWADAGVEAKTARGDIRIEEVARGSVVADTAFGAIEVGIADGAAAQLDLNSAAGTVYESLALFDSAQPSDETVQVRARTFIGDIVVRRSTFGPAGKED